jgi:hypothetical protein
MNMRLVRLPNGDWIDPGSVVIVAVHDKDDEGPDSAYIICRVGNLAVKHEIPADSFDDAKHMLDGIVDAISRDEEAAQEGDAP